MGDAGMQNCQEKVPLSCTSAEASRPVLTARARTGKRDGSNNLPSNTFHHTESSRQRQSEIPSEADSRPGNPRAGSTIVEKRTLCQIAIFEQYERQ